MITMVKITMMMMMQVREDEEVKAQLIQRIDNLTADNDCLKSEMDLVRKRLKQISIQTERLSQVPDESDKKFIKEHGVNLTLKQRWPKN